MTYSCSHCHRTYSNYHLACPDCGGWNSLRTQAIPHREKDAIPVSLAKLSSCAIARSSTGNKQLDKILGGGFVPGCSVLLAGPPGAGKSTLVIQLLNSMKGPSLYVTGEESVQQLKFRADRLKINSHTIFLLFEPNVNKVIPHADDIGARVLVLDSIQTIYTDISATLPGSATQIRKCAYILRRTAQQKGIVLVLVGQVTKERRAAGPKLLEHAVDVVLYLEFKEDGTPYRSLFATKNRFGSTTDRCTLIMKEDGLEFL